MEINYELTSEDYYQFSKQTASQKKDQPISVVLYLMFFVFVFADIFYALIFGLINDSNFKQLMFGFVVRTVLLFISLMGGLGIIRLFVNSKKKIVDNAPKNGLFCEHQLIVNEKELIEITDYNIARYNWKSIGEVNNFEDYLSVEVLLSGLYIIPKRYFRDQNHINEFIQTVS